MDVVRITACPVKNSNRHLFILIKGISLKIGILGVHVVKKKGIPLNLFVFGSCFRTLAVILF